MRCHHHRQPAGQLAHGRHDGGTRPWLPCTPCGTRVAVLDLRGGRFICRHGARVVSIGQSERLNGARVAAAGEAGSPFGRIPACGPRACHRPTSANCWCPSWRAELLDRAIGDDAQPLGLMSAPGWSALAATKPRHLPAGSVCRQRRQQPHRALGGQVQRRKVIVAGVAQECVAAMGIGRSEAHRPGCEPAFIHGH